MLPDTGCKVTSEPIVFNFRPLTANNTLFLDRDGVLVEAVMRGQEISSARNLAEVKLCEDLGVLGQKELLTSWNLVMVSNQPDLARRAIDLDFVKGINKMIYEEVPINAAYICPHQESDACSCRKPKTGLIDAFRRDHPRCGGKELMVGDSLSDLKCAQQIRIPFVFRIRSYNGDLCRTTEYSVNNLRDIRNILWKV